MCAKVRPRATAGDERKPVPMPTSCKRPTLFLSHDWGVDALVRDTHSRVVFLSQALQRHGCAVWLDNERLCAGDIDHGMAQGIADADIVLICLTRRYIEKVEDHCSDIRRRDNCGKEWNCASALGKQRLALVMEPTLLHTPNWGEGVVRMHLGTCFYVDATCDDMDTIARAVARTVSILTTHGGPIKMESPSGGMTTSLLPRPLSRCVRCVHRKPALPPTSCMI